MRPRFRPVLERIAGSMPKRWRRVGWQRNLTPIIDRKEWGADTADIREINHGSWNGPVVLVVHHTVTRKAKRMTCAAGAVAVKAVESVHAGNRGGIGYHYLASGGCLFEGRGFEAVAAAAFDKARGIGWNRGRWVHVAVPGDYSRTAMAPEDLQAIDDLVDHLARHGARVTSIVGHGDLMPTACPGDGGRASLKAYFGKRWKGKG